MSTRFPQSGLMADMFGKTRTAVLSLLFTHPGEEFYLRQIARATGTAVGALQRELKLLFGAGIIRREVRGHQVYFRADEGCPIFDELKGIAGKTAGAADMLRAALKPLAARIRLAFMFGSVAKGTQSKASDIDILIVGNVALRAVVDAIGPAQDSLRREINPSVYSPGEFTARIRETGGFVARISRGPKIFIVGNERELERLGRKRLGS